ncbi:MAG: DUF452 family protein [Candidatus Margulisbacteria bacterium]|nr:DUF452 family protein [Candidatus Margulisiibacteriota bacterium]
MQFQWVKQTSADSLIIFYTGWGMQPNSIVLETARNDLLVFYDYTVSEVPDELLKTIKKYKTIFVVAWSLGVVAALLHRGTYQTDQVIAINGSILPIDDAYGISTGVYQGTYDNLDISNLNKFYRRMFTCSEHYAKFHKIQTISEIDKLKQELISIKEFSKEIKIEDNKYFTKVFISKKDKIFPYNNLLLLWDSPIVLDNSHYPFFDYQSWDQLLDA